MTDAVDLASRAVARALELLTVLNREHTTEELHARARAVRHELETAQGVLATFGLDIAAPRVGKAVVGAPETSGAAARAIRTRSGSQRHRILRELVDAGPLADWMIQHRLGLLANSERPRRLELMEAGYVRAATGDTDEALTRKDPKTGHACQVWEVTTAGRVALDRLNAGQMVLVEVSA